jgi:hypothetical protein
VSSAPGNIRLAPRALGAGVSLSWVQVTGNEGYRVIWSGSSQTVTTQSIDEIAALYANSADTSTDANSYTYSGSAGTYYWRVAALVNGYPQEWSNESSFSG